MTNQPAGYPLDYGKSTTEKAKDQVLEMANSATEKLNETGEAIARATEKAGEYGEAAQDAAKQFRAFVEKSLKDQPMAVLAGGAAIGFILGAMWKK